MRKREVQTALVLVAIPLIVVALIVVSLIRPMAMVISGDQILKNYVIDGDNVTTGYWFLTATVNYPPGEIKMQDIEMEVPVEGEGAVATTTKTLKLDFDTYTPWERGTLARSEWRYLTIVKKFLIVGYELYWHTYDFPFYEIEMWRDAGVPYGVSLYIDDVLADSEKVLMGSAIGEGTNDSFKLEWEDDGETEEMTVYNLGWLNRGWTGPSEKYAFVYDPKGDIRIVDRAKLVAHLASQDYHYQGSIMPWENPSDFYIDSYEEAYNNFNIGNVGEVSNREEVWVLLQPDDLELIDRTRETLFLSDNPVPKLAALDFVDSGKDSTWFLVIGGGENPPEEKHGLVHEEETGYQIYAKGSVTGVNAMIEILADATLFDTIIWRPAAGVPEITDWTSEVHSYAETRSLVQVKVRNAGDSKDTFSARMTFSDLAYSWEPLTGDVQIGVNKEKTIWMTLVGPYMEAGAEESYTYTIYVKNLGEPMVEVSVEGAGTHTGTGVDTWGTVRGLVTDKETGNPLSGAEVSGPGDWSITDSGGLYSITVATGTPTIRAYMPGYEMGEDEVLLAEGGDELVNFELEKREGEGGDDWLLYAVIAVAAIGMGGLGVYLYSKRRAGPRGAIIRRGGAPPGA